MLGGTIGERNLWRYDGLQQAAQYIEGELARHGYEPRRETYEVSRVPVSNIEAALTGTSRGTEIVLLGAHYDTVSGSPGANDNGTGVAALLELSRRFAGRPQPRTLMRCRARATCRSRSGCSPGGRRWS